MGGERSSSKGGVIEVNDETPPATEGSRNKDRNKDKDKDKKAAADDTTEKGGASGKLKPPPAAKTPGRAVAARVEPQGLSDEALTQIGKEKFEVQEDKLKDVARSSMSLLRDFAKMSGADRSKRVSEIRKTLLKYEMMCIRSWEQQEKRRRSEVADLEAEAARCSKAAEDEGERITELREVLDCERRRRKRYEGYEALATEVNVKKSRPELKAEIESTTADIARLRQQRVDLEAMTEERNQRAQLLCQAVLELKQDLRREQDLSTGTLEAAGIAPSNAPEEPPEKSPGDMVEVIS